MQLKRENNISSLDWKLLDGNSETVIGKWQKHGISLLPDQPWEKNKLIKAFPSTVISVGNKTRLYYYVYSLENASDYNLAIAELSKDGSWEKHPLSRKSGDFFSITNLPENWYPIQPNVIYISPNQWRMYFWVHGEGICRLLAAESCNGLNWHVLNAENPCLYHIGNDYASRNGSAPRELCANDATTVYMLPDKTFEMYSAALIITKPDDPRYIGHDISPGAVRFVQRWTSKDGLHWNKPEIVLAPDDKDPIDLQLYYLSVAHIENSRLGFTGYYTADNQIQGLEMVLSQDGKHWSRPVRGNCFPMDEKYDCYGVYAPHSFLFDGNNLIMYYSGTNATHNKEKCSGDKPENTIAKASINYKKIFGQRIQNGCLMSPPIKLSELNPVIYLDSPAELELCWCDLFGREIPSLPVEKIILDNLDYYSVSLPEQLKYHPVRLKLSGTFTLFDLEY
jgi:predicted GH43/DUF377 family glycosyl hydrolase